LGNKSQPRGLAGSVIKNISERKYRMVKIAHGNNWKLFSFIDGTLKLVIASKVVFFPRTREQAFEIVSDWGLL